MIKVVSTLQKRLVKPLVMNKVGGERPYFAS